MLSPIATQLVVVDFVAPDSRPVLCCPWDIPPWDHVEVGSPRRTGGS
jgi:hypothetical protein